MAIYNKEKRMLVRIALTETPSAEGRTDAFVISWPLENDPRHMTAGASEAVRREVGGLPAVLKTELISDRVWRGRSQLELGLIEYISWFNDARLHESLGDIPPAEFEALHADRLTPRLRRASIPTRLNDES